MGSRVECLRISLGTGPNHKPQTVSYKQTRKTTGDTVPETLCHEVVSPKHCDPRVEASETEASKKGAVRRLFREPVTRRTTGLAAAIGFSTLGA